MTDIKEEFDRIITQRVLINLASWEEQKRAILNVRDALKPGGTYIMIENTNDAFRALNDMRRAVDLKPIGLHWHNLFFDYKRLMRFLKKYFDVVAVRDFGLYYFLTRVYVQMFANFVGFGKRAESVAASWRTERGTVIAAGAGRSTALNGSALRRGGR